MRADLEAEADALGADELCTGGWRPRDPVARPIASSRGTCAERCARSRSRRSPARPFSEFAAAWDVVRPCASAGCGHPHGYDRPSTRGSADRVASMLEAGWLREVEGPGRARVRRLAHGQPGDRLCRACRATSTVGWRSTRPWTQTVKRTSELARRQHGVVPSRSTHPSGSTRGRAAPSRSSPTCGPTWRRRDAGELRCASTRRAATTSSWWWTSSTTAGRDLDVPAICDRRFGVGADGLIRRRAGTEAPRSRSWTTRNADGTRRRDVGQRHALRRRLVRRRRASSRTARRSTSRPEPACGTSWLTLEGRAPSADGAAQLHEGGDPDARAGVGDVPRPAVRCGRRRTMRATRGERSGNPHLVLFTDEDPERYHLEHIGPGPRASRARSPSARTWSSPAWRPTAGSTSACGSAGVGETMACGTRRLRGRRGGERGGPGAGDG